MFLGRITRTVRLQVLVVGSACALLATSGVAVATNYLWDTGTGNWSVAGNWTPAGPPGSADAAYLGSLTSNFTVTMDVHDIVAYLRLANGARLTTATRQLTVYGNALLDKTAAGVVKLYVSNGGWAYDFNSDPLDIDNGAELDM